MPVGGKDVHIHLGFEDTVDKAVLLGDFAAPAVRRLPFQGFRVAGAGLGMGTQFLDKTRRLCKGLGFTLGQTNKINLDTFGKSYLINHSPGV